MKNVRRAGKLAVIGMAAILLLPFAVNAQNSTITLDSSSGNEIHLDQTGRDSSFIKATKSNNNKLDLKQKDSANSARGKSTSSKKDELSPVIRFLTDIKTILGLLGAIVVSGLVVWRRLTGRRRRRSTRKKE